MLNQRLKEIIFIILSIFFFVSFSSSFNLIDQSISARQVYLCVVSAVLLISVGIALIFKKGSVNFWFNKLDYAVGAFFVWSFIRLIFTPNISLLSDKIIELFLLTFFYFVAKSFLSSTSVKENSDYTITNILIAVFLLSGLAQAVIGVMQKFSIDYFFDLPSYRVMGTFESTDFYAGYIVCFVTFGLGVYWFVNSDSLFNRIIKYIGLATFLAGFLVLPSTLCRSSWLAFVLSAMFLATVKYGVIEKIKAFIKRKKLAILFVSGAVIVSLSLGYWVYNIKPDSANGRLFIWKVVGNMIFNNPVAGVGFDRFKIEYLNYQADYFASGVGTFNEMKSVGHVLNAYNEPLQIFAELGVIGFAIFIAVLVFAFRGFTKEKVFDSPFLFAARSGVIAYLVYSCFSYPTDILPTYINFFFLLAVVSANKQSSAVNMNVPVYLKYILAIGLIIAAVLLYLYTNKIYNVYTEWQNASWSSGAESIDKYNQLYPRLQDNGKYLFMYGGALTLEKKYAEAIPLLESAKNNYNDQHLWISLGQCYEEVGNYKDAEAHYQKAINMIPHKFYPRYLLIKMLFKIGRKEEAKDLGNKLLVMEEKIPSPAIQEMKDEIRGLIGNTLLLPPWPTAQTGN